MSDRLKQLWIQLQQNQKQLIKPIIKILAALGSLSLISNILVWKLLYPHSMDGQKPEGNIFFFRNPSERSLPFENIEIQENGITLKGWFIKQNNYEQANTVVFFHENAGNIGWRLEYLQYYYNAVKCNIVIVAYRGYSNSNGTPYQYGIQKDSLAITKYVFENLPINKQKIYAHGRSLGGAVASYACYTNQQTAFQYKGVILENTFTSINDVVSKMSILLKFVSPLILFNTWKTINYIGKIQIPILFISSGRDELVKYNVMSELINSANPKLKKEFHIPTGDHNGNWLVDKAEYFSKIYQFMNPL